MRFLNLAVASAWALSNLAASQVIVTVTRVITVDPPTSTVSEWTTTVTKVTTVTKPPTTKPSSPGGGHTTTVVTTVYVTTTPKTPPTTTEPIDPNTTKCPVPLYYRCGGRDWTGCTVCARGYTCKVQNEWYYQCVDPDQETPPGGGVKPSTTKW